MKLITFRDQTGEHLARVEGEQIIPFDFPGGMMGLIEAGQTGLELAGAAITTARPLNSIAMTTPLPNPSKIVAIGKNYAAHAKEFRSDVPDRPIVFTKFTTAINGPGAAITWRTDLTTQVDYEAELAVVISRTARHVSLEKAMDYVFGYTCANDVSARDLQFSDKQWVRSKSLDTFCPLGPWLVTADEIPDPQGLAIRCLVNGEVRQDSHTRLMVFNVAYLISFLSTAFTLLPGDIILTGTPDGVGAFRDPPGFLQYGDETIVEIEKIGRLVNQCVAPAA